MNEGMKEWMNEVKVQEGAIYINRDRYDGSRYRCGPISQKWPQNGLYIDLPLVRGTYWPWSSCCINWCHWRFQPYHHSFGVASQGVLKQTGEFRVPVWHVGASAIHQRGDDIPQGREGQVDLGSLLQSLSCGAGLPLPLRPLCTEKPHIRWTCTTLIWFALIYFIEI